MSLKNRITKVINQTLPSVQVLTDLEDIYVYSFEKIFLEQNNLAPNMVIRVSSLKEEKEVRKLVKKEGAFLIERGKSFENKICSPSRFIVLLDNAKIPNLRSCINQKYSKKEIILDIKNLDLKGYGTKRNVALAVQNLFAGKVLAKCKECSTCSGYCTVSPSFNGAESWSSKGRMLLTRGIMRGELTFSDKIIDIMYNCTKCGLCYAQCFQDLEFHEAIMYMRHLIAEKNLAPQIFCTTADNIFKYGDPAGISPNRRLSKVKNFHKLKLPEKASNLCWLGCTVATRTPKTADAFINILNRLNTEFTMLGNNEGCCGYVLLSTGLWEEAKRIAADTIARIEKTNAQTLITPCSGCYYTFKRLYPEILNIEMPCEIVHSSQFLETMIKNREIHLNPLNLNVTYHDPCSLGRHSNVYDAPRNVLKAIPNLNLVEMSLNRECARCCGGGGGLWTFNNEVSLESSQTRLTKDVIPTNVNILSTACPQCQLNFRFAYRKKNLTDNSLKVYDITELFELAM
ncbi:MAG: (Fe-S)-binding protein [Candidatus Thorarchaeota archaeon]